ncbi:MAG TPA: MmgE/PrpD family protein, partial [Bacillales bacterium]|nr:MmgE/PrpD family protein [Bacillales bacterium]
MALLSEALAQYIVEMEYERLPGEVVAFTKLCILDWYGSALAGKDQPPVQMIREMIEEMGGNPQATLVTGGKT